MRTDDLLAFGDDALIASHRLAEVITTAPQLEEDVAVANLSLDLLGQARMLLSAAGQAMQPPRSEDDLAYLRDEHEFRNCQLVEQPNTDFGYTIARQFLFSQYQLGLYARLVDSADEPLAAVAGKAVKEVAYHVEHTGSWLIRLGDGTQQSHQRMQTALDALWGYTTELFRPDTHAVLDPATLRDDWDDAVGTALATATLKIPQTPPAAGPAGKLGRDGVHTECFGYLLAEMQHLHRCYPGGQW